MPKIIFNCVYCGVEFKDWPMRKRVLNPCCSRQCAMAVRNFGKFGPSHPRFVGKPYTDKDGYLTLFCPVRKRPIMVHRLVVEKDIGRFLNPDETIHHKDHNKQNNHIKNLEILSRSEHSKLHKSKLI